MVKLAFILREKRLRWLGHLQQMENMLDSRIIAKQALHWQPTNGLGSEEDSSKVDIISGCGLA